MDTTSRRNRYIETGDMFARTISIRGFDCILDIGCGENLYKDIPNVIGIDNVGPHCDVLADMNYHMMITASTVYWRLDASYLADSQPLPTQIQ